MIVNEEIITERLAKIIESKMQNDIKINDLEEKARELKKRLQIDAE